MIKRNVITPDNLGSGVTFNPSSNRWDFNTDMQVTTPLFKDDDGKVNLNITKLLDNVNDTKKIANPLYHNAQYSVGGGKVPEDYSINSMKGFNAHPGVNIAHFKITEGNSTADELLADANITSDMIPGLSRTSNKVKYVVLETYIPLVWRVAGTNTNRRDFDLRGTFQRLHVWTTDKEFYVFTRLPKDSAVPKVYENGYNYPRDGFYSPFNIGWDFRADTWFGWEELTTNIAERKLKEKGLL